MRSSQRRSRSVCGGVQLPPNYFKSPFNVHFVGNEKRESPATRKKKYTKQNNNSEEFGRDRIVGRAVRAVAVVERRR